MPQDLEQKLLDEIANLTLKMQEDHTKFEEQSKKFGDITTLSAEQEEKITKMNTTITELTKQMDETKAAFSAGGGGKTKEGEVSEKMAELSNTYLQYLCKGDPADLVKATALAVEMKGTAGIEHKDMVVNNQADGGLLVVPDTTGRIIMQSHESSPMRQFATVRTVPDSDALEGIRDTALAGGRWVGETQTGGKTTTPELGMYRIPTHGLEARPLLSQKLIDLANIDAERYIAEKVGQIFGLMENTAFVLGLGVFSPRGVLTYPAGTNNNGQIEQVSSGDATKLTADGLVSLASKLKGAYRAAAIYFYNRSTEEAIRLLKDGQGNYIWQRSFLLGTPATLNGHATSLWEDMPDVAADSLSVGCGDLRQTYTVVDRAGIRMLRDPYTSKPFVEMYSTKHVGGDVVNFEATKLQKTEV